MHSQHYFFITPKDYRSRLHCKVSRKTFVFKHLRNWNIDHCEFNHLNTLTSLIGIFSIMNIKKSSQEVLIY